jgi:AhpD family alkylhydroperoxidase
MSPENPMDALEKEMPDVVGAFRNLHETVAARGALSAETKKLIMISVSTALRCEPCIRLHVSDAKEMGIGRQEILEAAGVAVLLGGGPAIAYTSRFVLDELDA